MFESIKNSTDWIPYKIPRTIPRENPNDIYGLSFKKNADPEKNPSQFLEWKKLLPSGENLGDILYWTPSGDEGGGVWTVLSSPQNATETDPKFLSFNGNILWDEVQAGTGGAGNPHPWQILLREQEETTQFKVELNSKLYESLNDWEDIEISGLNSWTNASVGYILLSGDVVNGICTNATITSPQTTLPNKMTFSGENQTGFSIQIGYIYSDGNGGFEVRQNAFHNLTLINCCIDGKPAIYPFAT